MERPLRLLSLDGGGIRGLSSLYILRNVLSAIQRQSANEDTSTPTTLFRPCDYFDMIAGTSTGGLIAVMLGVLKMDIQTCIDAYLDMAPKIFPIEGAVSGSRLGRLKSFMKGDHRFDPAPLEIAIKRLVKEHLGPDATENEMMRSNPDRKCGTFVCVTSERPNRNFRFRSYESPKGAFEDVTIWEACRATSAAPTYFPPISIGNPPRTFVDGGLGYNNPIQALLEETTHIWPSRSIGCIVSIGTGIAVSRDVGRSLKPLFETLKTMSTDTEKVAREVKERMDHQYPNQDIYFRFNVQHGLENVGLEEWKELGRVQTVTEDYLQENWRLVDACATRILSKTSPVPLGTTKGTLKCYSTIPFPRDDNFVGREDILTHLDAEFITPRARRWASLYGLGGIGKSQIAIQYSYRLKEKQPQTSTFWVHASSEARFEQSYAEIAAAVGIAPTKAGSADILSAVSRWLASPKNGPWLLILDNSDDANILLRPQAKMIDTQKTLHQRRLLDLLPQVQHGAVLVTTRDRTCALEVVGHTYAPIEVDFMSRTESVSLLRTRLPDVSEDDATELVDALENVPLAITQAAAYIREVSQVSLRMYLAKFRCSNEDQAALLNKDKHDLRRDASVPNAVITSFELSFNQIRDRSPASADLLSLMSYFNRQSIPDFLLKDDADDDSSEDLDDLSFYECISPLLRFSLIRAEKGEKAYEIHRLVQTATRHWLRCLGSDQSWKERAIERVAIRFPAGGNQKRWAECEALVSHADEVLLHTAHSRRAELSLATLLHGTARYVRVRNGNDRLAETRARRALYLQRKYLDQDSSTVLHTMITLAVACKNLGKFQEAVELNESVMQRLIDIKGPEDAETLASMHNLACSYQGSGQLVQ